MRTIRAVDRIQYRGSRVHHGASGRPSRGVIATSPWPPFTRPPPVPLSHPRPLARSQMPGLRYPTHPLILTLLHPTTLKICKCHSLRMVMIARWQLVRGGTRRGMGGGGGGWKENEEEEEE